MTGLDPVYVSETDLTVLLMSSEPEADADEVYVDMQTGEVFGVWEDDEAVRLVSGDEVAENNRMYREAVEENPHLYLQLPLDPTTALKGFLDSEWTRDTALHDFAKNEFQSTIEAWKRAMHKDAPEVLDASFDYELEQIKTFIKFHFLFRRGVEAVFTSDGCGPESG